jgi:hypothetical protein
MENYFQKIITVKVLNALTMHSSELWNVPKEINYYICLNDQYKHKFIIKKRCLEVETPETNRQCLKMTQSVTSEQSDWKSLKFFQVVNKRWVFDIKIFTDF